jgi:hypothetical protein
MLYYFLPWYKLAYLYYEQLPKAGFYLATTGTQKYHKHDWPNTHINRTPKHR